MGGASVCCACRVDAPAMDVNARKKIRWAWLVITRLPSPAPLNFG